MELELATGFLLIAVGGFVAAVVVSAVWNKLSSHR